MNIALLGPSGVGKGTHAAQLAERFHLSHLATGDLFRRHLQFRSALGRTAETYMAQAELVPDEIVDAMVEEWADTLPDTRGALFDGFPRTLDQLVFLDSLLQRRGRELDAVVYLKAPDDVILRRLAGRLLCRKCQAPYHVWFHRTQIANCCDRCGGELLARPDDDPELAERRLRIFHRTTEPVLRHFAMRGKVVIVPGDGSIPVVAESLVAACKGILDHTAKFATTLEVAALAPPRPLLPAPRTGEMLNLVVLGGPGSGKGTQAERLSARLRIPHLSTGDLFREHLLKSTPLGQLARTFMEHGELVPDDVTDAMVAERLKQPDTQRGFILDGFPRTPHQAEALTEILERLGRRLSGVLFLKVSDTVTIERLAGRLVCRGCQASYHRQFNPPQMAGVCDRCGGPLCQRPDDTAETVLARLATFHRQTEPLMGFYRDAGLLHEVVGDGSVDEILQRALATVRALGAEPMPPVRHSPPKAAYV